MGLFGDIGGLINTLANPYGLPSTGEWNLQRGSFKNSKDATVIFFVETKGGQNPAQKTAIDQISDGGGRRLAVYEYPYVDGQGLDDLGRKGERFTFNIKFFGLNYQVLFDEFIQKVVNVGGTGTLSHPVRGVYQAKFLEYEFVHRHDEWNAVTIRAVFLEDNTGAIAAANLKAASSNSALRSALQALISGVAAIQQGIFAVQAILLLPNQVKNRLLNTLNSIKAQYSALLGQLAATFATDAYLQSLMASAATTTGGVTAVNSGTTTTGSQLPPVFQVGFSASDQANIQAQQSSFVNSNQTTSQKALFSANQVRAGISSAITDLQTTLGNDGFDIILAYRVLANQIQDVTQACISSQQSTVKIYRVPSPMSLRTVAFKNGLTADRQNDIEALNPYLGSINYIPANTVLVVPSS